MQFLELLLSASSSQRPQVRSVGMHQIYTAHQILHITESSFAYLPTKKAHKNTHHKLAEARVKPSQCQLSQISKSRGGRSIQLLYRSRHKSIEMGNNYYIYIYIYRYLDVKLYMY